MSTKIAPLLHPRQTSTPTASITKCTWPGHCLGDSCSSNDDCDHDYVCLGNKCSLCCETESSFETKASTTNPSLSATDPTTFPTDPTAASSTASAASETSINSTSKHLSTGAAAGIGVSVAVVLVIAVVVAIWIWRKRQQNKPAIAETPATGMNRPASGVTSTFTEDHKYLMMASQGETQDRTKLVELPAVQLVELEDDLARRSQYGNDMDNGPIRSPEERTPPETAPVEHAEEYEMIPQGPSHRPMSSSQPELDEKSTTKGSQY